MILFRQAHLTRHLGETAEGHRAVIPAVLLSNGIKIVAKVINIMPETGMKYLATALGQHIASGGSLSLSGSKQLQLECDYRGMCTIGGDTLSDSFALGQILLSIQGGKDNQRKDILSLEGSTAQFAQRKLNPRPRRTRHCRTY